ncbi:MAG: exonuclease domain-containing protein [Lachnospira sp.]
MNYIVLDLEWNQSPEGKECSKSNIPFEIIQIGAVKLDDQFNIVSEFDRYVRPKLYEKLHKKVEEIIDISIEELNEKGEDFVTAADDFFEWCGSDFTFCTWGGTDLIELQRNCAYYKVNYKFPRPFLFYDLQKLYSINFSDGKTRITLQHAVEEQQISSDFEYHRALNDARYSAMIMKSLDFNRVGKFYSIDTFIIPQNKKEEIHINFGNYEKYISRGFSSRENAALDKEVRACKCFICGKPMDKKYKWFSTNARVYYGLFECAEHGLIKGRFKIRSTDNKKYYAVRILKLTDKIGEEQIKQKKLNELEHRRAKRKAK